MIFESFEVLQNDRNIGTHIHSFKEYLVENIRSDEEFHVDVVSTFVAIATSMNDEARRRKYLPLKFIMKQIQEGWKGKIDILRSLKERYSPLEDKKSTLLFKITNAIDELGNPPLVIDFTFISIDDMEAKLSKLKDKWAREFDSLSDFYKESIKTQMVDYVNLNNNISIIVDEAREEFLEIEK